MTIPPSWRQLLALSEDIDRLERASGGHVYGFLRQQLDQWKAERRELLARLRAEVGPDPSPDQVGPEVPADQGGKAVTR